MPTGSSVLFSSLLPPGDVAQGSLQMREGMQMVWGKMKPGALDALLDFAASDLSFLFIAADGNSVVQINTLEALDNRGLMCVLPRGQRDLPAETSGVFFTLISLSVSVCDEIFGADAVVRTTIEEHHGSPAVSFLPLAGSAWLAMESVRRCSLTGVCRMLVLSARCHELLGAITEALSSGRATTLPLAKTEERVRAAAKLLETELTTTPSLADLARQVGLSDTTLKRGFRQVFSTTVFGYLRAARMDRARVLLQSGQATVIEAAEQVGYSNPSNFAAAFRERFGVNPKEFQLTARR